MSMYLMHLTRPTYHTTVYYGDVMVVVVVVVVDDYLKLEVLSQNV